MQAQEELIDSKGNAIPVENFKWQVYSTNGSGITPTGWQSFKKDSPVLVYSSGGSDNYGQDVNIKLRFAIDTPDDAIAGSYKTAIVYSMTETP